MKKYLAILSVIALSLTTLVCVSCGNDDEPTEGPSRGMLTINNTSTTANICVFDVYSGRTAFSYDVFDLGGDLNNFDFTVSYTGFDSEDVGDDLAEDIVVRNLGPMYDTTYYDYEYISGEVIVKSASNAKIALQFNNFIFTLTHNSTDEIKRYSVKGTVSFTRDGDE